MSPLLLALMLVAAGPDAGASSPQTRPYVATPAPRRPLYLPEHVTQVQEQPSSLSQRLRAVRQRYGGLRQAPTPLEVAQKRRREELERPLPAGSFGAVSRRAVLGQRAYPSRDDRRLGSEARRALLSRAPAPRVRRSRR